MTARRSNALIIDDGSQSTCALAPNPRPAFSIRISSEETI